MGAQSYRGMESRLFHSKSRAGKVQAESRPLCPFPSIASRVLLDLRKHKAQGLSPCSP